MSDLVGAQLRWPVADERRQMTGAEREALRGALADTERLLATLGEISGVRYPP